MPRPVYSARLLQGSTFTGLSQEVTAPAGFVTVVRELTGAQVDSGAGNLLEWILSTPTGAAIVVAYHFFMGPNDSYATELRLVLNAGDVLTAAAEGAERVDVTASGYFLSLP